MSDSVQYKLREHFQDDGVALFQIVGGACTAALTTSIIVLNCQQHLEELTAPENEIQIQTERKQSPKLSFRDCNHPRPDTYSRWRTFGPTKCVYAYQMTDFYFSN